jgi:uncharacterized protein (DUF488 family)
LKNKLKPQVFSVGYEGKSIDFFLNLLIKNHVELLVDVRANAFSMRFEFRKKKLANFLQKAGIEYMHVPELGINSFYRKNWKNDYKKLFELYENTLLPKQVNKINELAEIGRNKRIALMCFEKNKEQCHRNILSKKLENLGINVIHL